MLFARTHMYTQHSLIFFYDLLSVLTDREMLFSMFMFALGSVHKETCPFPLFLRILSKLRSSSSPSTKLALMYETLGGCLESNTPPPWDRVESFLRQSTLSQLSVDMQDDVVASLGREYQKLVSKKDCNGREDRSEDLLTRFEGAVVPSLYSLDVIEDGGQTFICDHNKGNNVSSRPSSNTSSML
eukprot:m.77235 g.77235  ORF g.77235 m.77235 type:complete len:185 (-) comp11907_c0_seq2:238-792(-)